MPVVLPLALAGSFLFLVKSRMETRAEYNGYMKAAAEYAQNGVLTDAVANYQAAIRISPTPEGYLAVGQLYLDNQQYREAEKWYTNELLELYPDDARSYEFGLRTALAQEDPAQAFTVYEAYQDRGLQSDAVEEQIKTVWYSFDLQGDYEDVGAFSLSNNLAAVQERGNWGYIGTDGSRVVSNIYASAGMFGDIAPVVDQNGEAYYIDAAGNKKLTASYFLSQDPDFGQITRFEVIQSGLVLAYNGDTWNYYDAETHQKRFGGYKDATLITNGTGAVSQDGRSWALISQDGTELTGYDFQEVLTDEKGVPCRTAAVIVRQDGQYRLVNKDNGQPIGDGVYEDACAFNENSLAAVKKNGRWIFVSENGAETDLGDLEEAKSFSAGVAAAKKGGKWGYINQSGEWIIEPQFYDAKAFTSAGVAFVKAKEDKWQLLELYRFQH